MENSNAIEFICVEDTRSHTLRARTVDEKLHLAESAEKLKQSKIGFYIRSTHGGDVANSYKYPAFTEGLLIIGLGDKIFWWATQLPANKVTLSGVVSRVLPEAVPIFDKRYNSVSKAKALLKIISTIEIICSPQEILRNTNLINNDYMATMVA